MKKYKLKKEEIQVMLNESIIAENNAFVPITGHRVGACLVTQKGNFYKIDLKLRSPSPWGEGTTMNRNDNFVIPRMGRKLFF